MELHRGEPNETLLRELEREAKNKCNENMSHGEASYLLLALGLNCSQCNVSNCYITVPSRPKM